MSRTIKGSKPPGYYFWSPRPGNKGGGGRGKFAKVNTHRIERRNAKIAVRKELAEA